MMKLDKIKKSSGKKVPLSHPSALISTVFGIGRIPIASGTFGSLAGLVLTFVILKEMPEHMMASLLIAIIIIFNVAMIAVARYLVRSGGTDPKEVVIDEVIGMMAAVFMAMLVFLGFEVVTGKIYAPIDLKSTGVVISAVAAFLLFRIFDILKTGPVGWAERKLKGALGVIMDDVIAGAIAGIIVGVAAIAIMALRS